jgi:hypothetical protein
MISPADFNKIKTLLLNDRDSDSQKQLDKLDDSYKIADARHRIRLSWMNHVLEYVSHTLFLMGLVFFMWCVVVICHALPYQWARCVAMDCEYILSYGFCAVVTYLITTLLNRPKDDKSSHK